MQELIIIAIVIVSSFIFWIVSDSISNWGKIANPWLGMLVYTILNPVNWFILYFLIKKYGFRGLLSGFIIAIIIDIFSLPHSIMFMGGLPSDAPLFLYSDTTFYHGLILPIFGAGWLGVFMLYVILPTILIVIAALIVQPKTFVTIFKKQTIESDV